MLDEVSMWQHAGIGCTLDKVPHGHGHHIRISEIVPNGSLYRDGRILSGDRITHISGKQVEEYPVNKILEEIVGPCASLVDLTVVREASQGVGVRCGCKLGTLPCISHRND